MAIIYITLKQCNRKDKCINPLGSWLPATAEYFPQEKKRGKDILRAQCRVCRLHYSAQYRKRPEVIEASRVRNQQPHVKQQKEVYSKRPETKQQRAKYLREYRKRPEVAVKDQSKRQTEGYKEYHRNYRDDSEHKARKRELARSENAKQYNKAYRERPGMKDYFARKQAEYRQTSNYQNWSNSVSGVASRFRASSKRRKTIEQNTTGTVTTQALNALVLEYRGLCFYCGEKQYQAFDHVIPISRGGLHDIDNLVPACKRCNSSKYNRLFEEEWIPDGWS